MLAAIPTGNDWVRSNIADAPECHRSVALMIYVCPRQREIQLRNDFIHMLRGLAALGVACFHVYGHSLDPSAGIKIVRIVSEWGWLGVPVFFVISGFVIPNSLRGDFVTPRFAANYALRRSLRLDPPYWFAILVAVTLQAGIDYLLHRPVVVPSPRMLAAHAFYLQNILNLGNLTVGLWTLCLEVQFYIFFLALLAFS